jgi:NADPH-dependent 2,4-dienoyl-CoA reductase/sulfur reductase-like enzyme
LFSISGRVSIITVVRWVAEESLFYNANVKNWDVIVVGGGIIGLSLSLALHKR